MQTLNEWYTLHVCTDKGLIINKEVFHQGLLAHHDVDGYRLKLPYDEYVGRVCQDIVDSQYAELLQTKYEALYCLAGSVLDDIHYGKVFQFDVLLVHPKYRNNRAILRAFSKAKKAMVLQSGVTKYLNVKHLNSTTRLVQVKEY